MKNVGYRNHTAGSPEFTTGSLVTARGRDWVVLPGSESDMILVQPLGGTDAEVTGILTEVEEVTSAGFAMPDPQVDLGDAYSARLLRDALRLGFRSGAGPFRCAGRITVDPRPYQLVPLLMALRLDPVRLLIADDVGVGKTVEAALIARELLECGDARKLVVLCPPHLAEQWQFELNSKFHIDAELVLPSTAARLERNLTVGESLFEAGEHFVVSTDFIKSDRRRDDFIRACPELVIVDEAHMCASVHGGHAGHQRHSLVSALAENPDRHLILVTATPHSGKDEAFRSLLAFLDKDFAALPDDLAGDHNRHHRTRLARHLVQRRRSDIDHYLQTDTPFPERADAEQTYMLSNDYRSLFDEVLAYARQSIHRSTDQPQHKHRIRWWSALGLLRAMASSPAAAAATMRNRAVTAEAETAEQVDEIGRRILLDLDDSEEVADVVPGSVTGETISRTLRRFAERADELRGDSDRKLVGAMQIVRRLVVDGYRPVVFCRFIETAEYVAVELRERLRRPRTEVLVTTGLLPAAERRAIISELADHKRVVLVTTDCLSEGINLQDYCTAVVHYDLPWNPTRLEQREGRVDRFGQNAAKVRVVTYWGKDNYIDESVLKVLLRKHRAIRGALGVSIPVPGATSAVIDALTENVLLAAEIPAQGRLEWITETLAAPTEQLDLQWEQARQAEQKRRSLFAQHTIDSDTVAAELAAMREAIGTGTDVERFARQVLKGYGAVIVSVDRNDTVKFDITELTRPVRDLLTASNERCLTVRFSPLGASHIPVWSRTHPEVSAVSGHVLGSALDPVLEANERIAARCGVMRTRSVDTRTTLLLCRIRMSVVTDRVDGPYHMLAEETLLAAFQGSAHTPEWLPVDQTESLLKATPSGNVWPEAGRDFVQEVVNAEQCWRPHIDELADRQAEYLTEAHVRVRAADRRRGSGIRHGLTQGSGQIQVKAQHPTDILGIYVYLPIVS